MMSGGAGRAAVQQAGAIPYRRRGGILDICLITTASGGKWSIPKGFIDPGDSAVETAQKEAREEAGIHGRVVDGPVGYYDISKGGVRYSVAVYLLEVEQVDDDWEERGFRQRRWAAAHAAARLLGGRPVEAVFRRALAQLAVDADSRHPKERT